MDLASRSYGGERGASQGLGNPRPRVPCGGAPSGGAGVNPRRASPTADKIVEAGGQATRRWPSGGTSEMPSSS